MRVLTWNLFHGRSQPPSARSLLEEFAARIAAWDWDVALLQEVPPWWGPALAAASDAQQRTALTSRNGLLVLRRFIAERWPDLIKSNGGGANVVLVRGAIAADRKLLLRRWPERRVAQLLRLADGACVANFHGSTRVPLAREELERLAEAAREWVGGAPAIVGGDLNLRGADASASGLTHLAGHSVDHILASGYEQLASAELPERWAGAVELSDHRPLICALRRTRD